MKNIVVAAALLGSAFLATGQAEARGCIKGAIVGGIAGHFAGHHGLMGAAAGCAVGHHYGSRPSTRRSDTPPAQDQQPAAK